MDQSIDQTDRRTDGALLLLLGFPMRFYPTSPLGAQTICTIFRLERNLSALLNSALFCFALLCSALLCSCKADALQCDTTGVSLIFQQFSDQLHVLPLSLLWARIDFQKLAM